MYDSNSSGLYKQLSITDPDPLEDEDDDEEWDDDDEEWDDDDEEDWN